MKIFTRIFALFTAAAIATAAQGQTWTVGDQGADWSTIPSSYPTGAVPADAYEPAEIADPFNENDWIATADQYKTVRANPGNFYVNVSEPGERKARFTCVPSGKIIPQDFILRNVSHLHGGFGLTVWDQNSDYASARANPSSSCIGGPLLSQIYIEPQMMTTLSSGATVGLRAIFDSVYYVDGLQSDPHNDTWTRRGHKMIIGASPTNFNDTARRAVYAANNLVYPGTPDTPAGMTGWQCFNGANNDQLVNVTLVKAQFRSSKFPDNPAANNIPFSRYIWGSGPTDDPWGGNCVPSGGATYVTIIGNLIGPRCWDAMNLESPDGRGHMWWAAENYDSGVKDICPKTTLGAAYAKIPEPQFKSQYAVTGPAEYKKLYLTSDRMRMATTECPDAANPCDGTSGGNVPGTVGGVFYSRVSLDECRKVSVDFCPGSTFHADWGYGAQSKFFDEMQRQCLGITVRGVAPTYPGGAECGSGQYARSKALILGTSPNAALSAGCAVILQCFDPIPSKPKERYIAIPKTASGSTKVRRGMVM